MRNVWGPVPFCDDEYIRGSVKVYGPLKIDYMKDEQVERFEKIFSDLNTNDWILTTLFLFPASGHWESHPHFLLFKNEDIKHLESIDRKYINYLFHSKIEKNNVPGIYKTEDDIYNDFWQYIHGRVGPNDSLIIRSLYSRIDSLMIKSNN